MLGGGQNLKKTISKIPHLLERYRVLGPTSLLSDLVQMNSNLGLQYLLHTVKSRAVDRSNIQFRNFLAKGHST